MEDWTRVWWKVLALGVVASLIASYVKELLDMSAVAIWDETSRLGTQATAHPGHALTQVVIYVVVTGVMLKLALLRDQARARFLADAWSLAERHTHPPVSAPGSGV